MLRPPLLRLSLPLLLAAFGLDACVKSDFSGQNAAKKKPAQNDAAQADGGDFGGEMLDASDAGSDSDDAEFGEEDVDCATAAVIRPDETYQFADNAEIRAFVNTHCDVGIPTEWATQGAVRADQATMDKVCRLKGFEKSAGFDTKSWASPGDNHMAWWDDASRSFVLKTTSLGNNFYIDNLTCQGRVHEACSEELNKEKCTYD